MKNVKNLILGIGIVIVFALALWQGVEAFYPTPQYDDFCGQIEPRISDTDKTIQEIDNQYKECQDAYDTERDAHAKTVFIISIIVALITLIVGYTILSTEPVGSALLSAGIWSIFWGTVINWRNFSDIWRFALLIVVLILLIILAIRLNTKKKKRFRFF